MYEFLLGPMMWITLFLLVSGLLFRSVQLFRITRKTGSPAVPASFNRPGWSLRRFISNNFVLSKDPLLALFTIVFHSCLIITPLFLTAHSVLLFQSWQFSPGSFPEWISNIFTVIFLVSAGLLLLRRLIIPHVRAVSRLSDFLFLGLSAAPFVTGFLAFHQLIHYETIIILHIASGQLLLIAIGWLKPGHIIFFFFARFFIKSEFSFFGGSRKWYTP
ncbi:MAG: hypothetical protein GY754_08070 [bacterium]|nr:hypothetical protein [bacterium]